MKPRTATVPPLGAFLDSAWPLLALRDCCRVVNGTTPASGESEYWNGDVVWITPTDLGQLCGMYIQGSARRVTREAVAKHNLTICPKGSVVLSSRAPIGHLGIADVPLCTNQGCKTLVPRERVSPPYLYYALRLAVPELQALGSGATFAEISKSQVEAFEIPLPPLAEQERIASRLTAQLAEVERARAAAQARLDAAQALPAAYLREVFEGEEASGWETRRVDEFCTLLPSKSIASDGDTVVRAITTACLSERGFLPTGVKSARMRFDDVQASLARPGEVLIARSNTPELVGRVAMYRGVPADVVTSDLTIRIWVSSHHLCQPEFLAAYLTFLFLTRYWRERAGGASGTMKKITRAQISAEAIPLPPLADQRRIAADLAERLAGAERLAASLRAERDAIDALPLALLRKAFRGSDGV